jgi:molecular chaperone DnaJ
VCSSDLSVLGDETKRAQYDRYGSTEAYASAHGHQATGQGEGAWSSTGDPFWDWFADMTGQGGQSNEGRRTTYTYYGPGSWGRRSTGPSGQSQGREGAANQLLRSILMFLVGSAGLRYFWWLLFPLIPILCIGAMVNGIVGGVSALGRLLK